MKANKYNYTKVIQQNYGCGWEDASSYETDSTGTPKEKVIEKYPSGKWKYSTSLLMKDLKEYKLLGYPTRVIKRKELNHE